MALNRKDSSEILQYYIDNMVSSRIKIITSVSLFDDNNF